MATFKETNKRSLVKSFTWRIVGVISLAVVTFIATNDLEITMGVSFAYHILQVSLYFLHERIWDRVEWERR